MSSSKDERKPLLVNRGTVRPDSLLPPGSPVADVVEPPAEAIEPVSYFGLFQYSSTADIVMSFFGAVAASILGGTMPALTFVWGRLLDQIGENSTLDSINRSCLYMSLVGVGSGTLGMIAVVLIGYASKRHVARIRRLFFRSVLRQDAAWFDLKGNTPGELVSRSGADITAITQAIGDRVVMLCMSVFMALFGIAFAFYASWRVSVVVFATAPLLVGVGWWMSVSIRRADAMGRDAYAQAGATALEALQNVRVVKALGAQDAVYHEYAAGIEAGRALGIKKGLFTAGGFGGMELVIFGAYALSFWYGGRVVAEGGATGGVVLTAFFNCVFGTMSLGQCGTYIADISTGLAAAGRIFATIRRVPTIDSIGDHPPPNAPLAVPPPLPPPSAPVGIEFDSVCFRYPTRPTPVFAGLTFRIPPGATAAFVGHTGSGKSTVLALCARLYDPQGGTVRVNGVPITAAPLAEWRQRIGYVTQETVLFVGSVRDNVRLASPYATEPEIVAATDAAQLGGVIRNLPNGLDTNVGEAGAQLSGGQRQRLSIARALLRKPALLLLDEATSALDRRSELALQSALRAAARGRTTIVVAHRLATVQHADIIFVVEPPRPGAPAEIVEQGTHATLMAQRGRYYAMAHAQGLAEGAAAATDVAVTSPQVTPPVSPTLAGPAAGSAASFAPRADDAGHTTAAAKEKAKEAAAAALAAEAKEEAAAQKGALGKVMALTVRRWPLVLWGMAGAMAAACVYPGFAYVFGKVLAVFYAPDPDAPQEQCLNFPCVRFYSVLLALIGVVSATSNFSQMFAFSMIAEHITRAVRLQLFGSALSQEVAYFDAAASAPSAVAARIAEDASVIHAAAGPRLALVVRMFLTLALGMAIAFWQCWRLALVALSVVPLMIAASALQMAFMVQAETGSTEAGQERAKLQREAAGKPPSPEECAAQTAAEAITAVRFVQVMHLESTFLSRYSVAVATALRADAKRSILSGVGFGFSQLLTPAAFALMFWYGSTKLIPQGHATFESVMVCVNAILMSAMGAGEASLFAGPVTRAASAAARVFPLMTRVPRIADSDPTAALPPQTGGAVGLDDVVFTYPARPAAPVLDHVSFTTTPGTHTALVGPTGCGKSSALQLLVRLYDPDSGRVVDGGVDIRTYRADAWRHAVGYVPQEPLLLDTTVLANLTLGFPTAELPSADQVRAALEVAAVADEVAALPGGLSAQVGPRGMRLSGGQRQRLAVARALLRRPRVLVLDEATAALDSGTETRVLAGLHSKVTTGMSLISVAHRMAAVEGAECVVVLEGGSVIERGSHAELMAARGPYRMMVDLSRSNEAPAAKAE